MESISRHEELLVTLMVSADKVKLKYLVDNNLSLIQFAKNHPEFSKVMFWATFLLPFVDVNGISADRVMNFLQEKRPDIAQIINLNWVSNQIEEVKRWKNS